MAKKIITELKYSVPEMLIDEEYCMQYLRDAGFKAPKAHIGKLFHLLNYLRFKPHYKKNNSGDASKSRWVALHTLIIQKTFAGWKSFNLLIKKMQADGWLEIYQGNNNSDSYQINITSKKYRLTPFIKEYKWKSTAVKACNCSTTRKLILQIQKGWKYYDNKLHNMLTQFNIDEIPFFENTTISNFIDSSFADEVMLIREKAIKNIKRNRKRRRTKGSKVLKPKVKLTEENIIKHMKEIYSRYEMFYTSIKDGIWRYSPDEYGRRHTNLTNLPKQFRKNLYAIIGGEKKYFKEVDVSNSQVLLLLTILPKETKGYNEFKALVEDGAFYQFIAEKMGKEFTPEIKDQIKMQYFTFAYGKVHYTGKLFDTMKEVFPEIVQWLIDFKISKNTEGKNNGYKVPAQLMQKQESEIIFDYCSKKAIKDGLFFATIHDSFLCFEEDIEYFNEIIKEGFKTKDLNASTNIDKERAKELDNFYGYQQEEQQRKISLNQEFANPQESMVEVCYDYYI